MAVPRTTDRLKLTGTPGEDCDAIGGWHKTSNQHISCSPEFYNFSPEELRLNDYNANLTVNRPKPTLGLATYNHAILLPTNYDHDTMRNHSSCIRFGGEIVRFQVGSKPKKEFAIHESIASESSGFVRLALKKEWVEARTREIVLEDDDPEIFEIFQGWAYRSSIGKKFHLCVGPDFDTYQKLVKAYILGEKLLSQGFKRAVLSRIIKRLTTTSQWDLELTNIIYDNTPDQSPLRLFLRHVYLYTANSSWYDESSFAEPINGEFLRDLATDQTKLRMGSLPTSPPFLDANALLKTYGEYLGVKV